MHRCNDGCVNVHPWSAHKDTRLEVEFDKFQLSFPIQGTARHRCYGFWGIRGRTSDILHSLAERKGGRVTVHQAPLPSSSTPQQIPMLYSTIKQRIPRYQWIFLGLQQLYKEMFIARGIARCISKAFKGVLRAFYSKVIPKVVFK